jgi:hypothetical protein
MKKPTAKPKKKRVTKTVIKNGKKTYKVKNWKAYNKALEDRGRLLVHIPDDVVEAWRAARTGKVGHPQKYSNLFIETVLTVGQALQLPLRNTRGLFEELVDRLGMCMDVPSVSTLCKRGKELHINIRVREMGTDLHIVADSSGIKVFGEGEWKVRKHGYTKRRTWTKIHMAVDAGTHDVLSVEITDKNTHDCTVLPALLTDIPSLRQVSLDGAYDTRDCYHAITSKGAKAVIPPKCTAAIQQHGNCDLPPLPRDAHLRRIREIGRAQWKQETDYHRRSLSEVGFFRYKTFFGASVRARSRENQRTSLLIRAKLMNRYTMCGMPVSVAVG